MSDRFMKFLWLIALAAIIGTLIISFVANMLEMADIINYRIYIKMHTTNIYSWGFGLIVSFMDIIMLCIESIRDKFKEK